MTNDLSAELKALLEKGDIRDMIVEPLEDGEWCSITTPSIDVCGDNVVIYARRMGGMMITRWAYNVKEDPAFTGKIKSTMADDILTSSIFTYSPRTYWYHLEELSDRAIPFLLFNAAIRGINAVIIQCDSLDRKAKRAFYVKNDSDNFLAFSDILEVPKTDKFGKFLNVKWGELE